MYSGVGTTFRVGDMKGEAGRPRTGVGIGGGQSTPPHQLEGLGELCKLPQRGPGQNPGLRGLLLY